MTEKQYKKYIVQVNIGIIKSVWCKKCKHQDKCNKELQEICCIRYETSKHKDKWTFEEGLAKEVERDKKRKEKLKELKKKKAKKKNEDM